MTDINSRQNEKFLATRIRCRDEEKLEKIEKMKSRTKERKKKKSANKKKRRKNGDGEKR